MAKIREPKIDDTNGGVRPLQEEVLGLKKKLKWPQFKRFQTPEDLYAQAAVIYKGRANLQLRWVEAVVYLRTQCKKGWVGDERVHQVLAKASA
jgi:hypothetical protein